MRETRTYTAELRFDPPTEQGQGNTLKGRAVVFNSDSEIMADKNGQPFVEQIAPGAFTRTLQTSDVVALAYHDDKLPLGRVSAGNLRLVQSAEGLDFELTLPDLSYAHDLRELVRLGIVRQCSFGFVVVEETESVHSSGMKLRTINDVELFEISMVTWPAYEATSVGLRKLEERRRERDRQLKLIEILERY